MHRTLGLLFCCFCSVLAGTWIGGESGTSSPSLRKRGVNHYRLNAAYYNVADYQTILLLNNKSPEPVLVRARVYDLRGRAADLPPFEVPGNDFIKADLMGSLRTLPGRFDQGSIELRYWGNFLQVDAQLRMFDRRSRGFGEQFVRPEEFQSSSLRANWWLPNLEARLIWIFSNTSEKTLIAEGALSSIRNRARFKNLVLRAHETRVIEADPSDIAGLIDLAYDGEPGDLIVRALVLEASSDYTSVIECNDPSRSRTSELHGAGLRLGSGMAPVLSLANHGDEVSLVSISLAVSDGGDVREIRLPDVSLRPSGIKTVEHSAFEEALAAASLHSEKPAGIRISYSTAPGNVTGYAASVSADQDIAYRVPLLDANMHFSSAGIYPWDLQASQNTVLYVKNLTPNSRWHQFYLTHGKEIVYFSGYTPLEPGESVAVDIAQLRDEQEIDKHGRFIPREADKGQIHWSVLGEGVLLGARVEQIDLAHGSAASYSGAECCNNTVHTEFLPNAGNKATDDPLAAFLARQTTEDSQGNWGPTEVVQGETMIALLKAQGLEPATLTPRDHPGTPHDGAGNIVNPYRAGDRILLEFSPKPDLNSLDLSTLQECCNSPEAFLTAQRRFQAVSQVVLATCEACGPMFQNIAVDYQSSTSSPALLAYNEPQRESNLKCKITVLIFGSNNGLGRIWVGDYWVRDQTPGC